MKQQLISCVLMVWDGKALYTRRNTLGLPAFRDERAGAVGGRGFAEIRGRGDPWFSHEDVIGLFEKPPELSGRRSAVRLRTRGKAAVLAHRELGRGQPFLLG